MYLSTATDSAPSEASASRFKNPGGVMNLSFALSRHLLSGILTGEQCASGELERIINVGEARQPAL